MATTRLILTPEAAHFPSSNYAALSVINNRPVLLFDGTTDEFAYWTTIAWQGLSGALTAIVHCFAVTGASGTLSFDCALEAITDGDTTNLNTTDSFGTDNTGTGTVGGTGYEETVSITLTNNDSIAVGDLVRVRLNRDNAGDGVTGDVAVTAIEIREA